MAISNEDILFYTKGMATFAIFMAINLTPVFDLIENENAPVSPLNMAKNAVKMGLFAATTTYTALKATNVAAQFFLEDHPPQSISR